MTSGVPGEEATPANDASRKIADLERALTEARHRIEELSETQNMGTRAELIRKEFERVRERLGEAYEIEEYARALYVRDKQRRAALEAEIEKTKRELRVLRRNPLVRAALKATRIARPPYRVARRVVRKLRRARNRERRAQPPAVRKTQSQLRRALRKGRPARARKGPLVSILILTRDGQHHMVRVLTGLRDRTAYRSFEVIIVDNASSDDTASVVSRDWGYPVKLIRNEENSTFSGGNNQALAAASGELVLLLNNDVDPITPGWLGALVETVTAAPERSAAGALLVYPDRPGLERPQHPDLTVQHGGVGFFLPRGAPHARNLGGGTDPLDPRWRETRPVPAATAACLLVRRDQLETVGGLDEGYVYGTEDVDLCLKLRARGGQIWFCGDAVLFHHEFGTQSTVASEEIGENRARNWQLFAERWGPQLWRSVRLDQLDGDGTWIGDKQRTIAITITDADPAAGWGDWFTAHALGNSFERVGWRVIYADKQNEDWYRLPPGIDVIVILHDDFDLTRTPLEACSIAWVRNWTDRWIARPWFGRFDVVVASSEQSARIIRETTLHDPVVLALAGDPEHFRRDERSSELAYDYTFTGSNWGASRRLASWLDVRDGEAFGLYGKGWDENERMRSYARGFLDYRRLPELYASTKIVLDDTAEHTLPYAAMNSRVFEALLCGALVLTNNVVGSFELFDGLLPTYSSPEELRAQLDRYLSDDALREATVEQLRAIVLERHTFDRRREQFLDAARVQVQKPRVALKIATSNAKVAKAWGDTHFANDFGRALRARGVTARVDLRDAWDARERQTDDVVVQLRGLHAYRTKPAHLNVMWVISHPEDVAVAECDGFDAIFVASTAFAEELRRAQAKPVHVLQQATDTDRFRPVEVDPELRSDLLFVGNSRNQFRPVVRWALELGMPLTLYGEMWEQFVPEGTVRAQYFPNERLAELYSSADIVLCDHWDDMVRYGFISNRIFDALACGAFVVSDRVAGIDEAFAGAVPTFGTKEEFAAVIERFRGAPAERAQLAEAGMELVRKEHSFEARADEFLATIEPMLRARPRTIEDVSG